MVLNFIPSTTFSACTLELDGQTSIANTVKTASYVFQGTVKKIDSSQLVIQVSQYFKGNGLSTVTVTPLDENCGKQITTGQEALFFIKTDIKQSAPSVITNQELILIQPVSPEIITEITANVDCMATYHPEQGKVYIPCLAMDQGIEGIYSADLSLKSSESLLLSVDRIQPQKPFTARQLAKVEQIDIQILKSLPIQVQVVVTGQLANPCQKIDQIQVVHQDNTYNMTITTINSSPPDMDCPDMLVPFKEIIPLDVTGLKAGIYTVNVNDISDTFELAVENILFKALIKKVDIQVLESIPVKVNAKIKGQLSTGCQQLDQVDVTRTNNVFKVTLTITPPPPPELACTTVLIPFEKTVPLDVQGLKAGVYTVEVNGISNQFELAADNVVDGN
jgi:inhibitor of cysteine peptidase